MAIQAAGNLMEGCVLAFLSREDTYGYVLTQRIKETLDVSESTLYPVMRRLQTDKCLTVYDLPQNGRNRRYYRITDEGREKLTVCRKEWQVFKEGIDRILLYNWEEKSNG